jgi:hypothetical protein
MGPGADVMIRIVIVGRLAGLGRMKHHTGAIDARRRITRQSLRKTPATVSRVGICFGGCLVRCSPIFGRKYERGSSGLSHDRRLQNRPEVLYPSLSQAPGDLERLEQKLAGFMIQS